MNCCYRNMHGARVHSENMLQFVHYVWPNELPNIFLMILQNFDEIYTVLDELLVKKTLDLS